MKNYFFTLFLGLMANFLFGQNSQTLNRKLVKESEFFPIQRDLTPNRSSISTTNENPSIIPIGTIGTTTENIVTATKIGESSNALSFINKANRQISTVNNVGFNQGSVAFIYQENILQCGSGSTGNLRYSISTDGGQIWDTGSGNCYGLGPINPFYSNSGRYPNLALFVPPGKSLIPENINLIYSTTGSNPGPGSLGPLFGLVSNVADSPIVEQELIPFWGGNQYFPNSLTERVPGEYWTATWDFNGTALGTDIYLNRGVYDSALKEVDWQSVAVLSPDFNLSFNGDPFRSSINIAFSPDGTTGYVAILSDLNGKQDSVFAPCFASSSNGGLSWSIFEELDFTQYTNFGLMDSIVKITDIDTVNNVIVNAAANPTTAFDFDLTVDKHGNPHLVAVVGGGSYSLGDGTYTEPQYTLLPGLGMAIFDFTKDANGAWNMINLSRQATFRGEFGDIIAGGSESYIADPWMQASRSPDGSKVFFSWTDSDTTGIGGTNNDEPDFITIGLDVDSYNVSPVTNWTHDDVNFAGKALLPKIPPVSFSDGVGEYNIPAVIMDFGPPGTSILNLTSYYYFSNISIHDSTFTQAASFFSNCLTAPFTNVLTVQNPDCGMANGKAWITPGGGFGNSYSYQWNPSGGNSDTLLSVSAGAYSVIVTDSLGCTDEKQFILNNANAATVTISQVQNVSCNGLSDGMIDVALTGGSAPFSFIWSNGSMTQNLSGIPAGTYALAVTDNANCLSFISATITEPVGFDLVGAAKNVTCGDGIDGEILINVIGSTGPYSYLWNHGDTTQYAKDLIAGAYNVTVTDINGCSKIDSFVVTQPSSMVLSSSSSPDNGTQNGLATISATGGTPPYTYSWSNGSTVPVVSGLAAGTYTVTVFDAVNCEKVDTIEVASTVSLDDLIGLGINELKLYPNPAREMIHLAISLDDFEKPEIKLLDLRGKTILELEADQVGKIHQFSIPLTNLAEGVYFLSVKTGKGKTVRRFVKTN